MKKAPITNLWSGSIAPTLFSHPRGWSQATVGVPEKPFHSPDLGTPCCETKV
jgi:hypothetical protein